MADYTADIEEIAADIAEEGELVLVTLAGGVVEDPKQPWKETEAADLEWEDIPLLYDVDRSSPFRAYIKGTDIPAGAALGYMPANVPFVPTQEHRIHTATRGVLKIDGIDVIAPGPQVLLYVLRLVQ